MRAFLLCLTLGGLGCSPSASATFPFGTSVSISGAAIEVPEALQTDDGAPAVASVPCGPSGMCPSTADLPVLCMDDLCDPEPVTIERPVGDVVDIEAAAGDASVLFREIDTVRIEAVEYEIEMNTLGVGTTPLEVFWGPAGAAAVSEAMGVRLLGTVPAIEAGATGSGSMSLDAAGVAAFTEHFETEGRRYRFFARTTIDIDPGSPIPSGDVELAVRVIIEASGSLL
ncbi:MAG: hypothetical protein AAF411_25130 [Myxococcota bacterium]